VGPEAAHPEILEFMETAFRRAQKAGVEYIVFGSGGSRSIPEGFSRDEARRQFIDLCSRMAPIAAKYDVVVVLEPLNTKECNFINSVMEGGEIVEEVNHPNFRLLADIYHMLMEGEGSESIEKFGHLIHHTHIAEKEGRAAPGTHNEDFTAYFKALKDVGYKGKMSIECRWEDLETQAPTAIAANEKTIDNFKIKNMKLDGVHTQSQFENQCSGRSRLQPFHRRYHGHGSFTHRPTCHVRCGNQTGYGRRKSV